MIDNESVFLFLTMLVQALLSLLQQKEIVRWV